MSMNQFDNKDNDDSRNGSFDFITNSEVAYIFDVKVARQQTNLEPFRNSDDNFTALKRAQNRQFTAMRLEEKNNITMERSKTRGRPSPSNSQSKSNEEMEPDHVEMNSLGPAFMISHKDPNYEVFDDASNDTPSYHED